MQVTQGWPVWYYRRTIHAKRPKFIPDARSPILRKKDFKEHLESTRSERSIAHFLYAASPTRATSVWRLQSRMNRPLRAPTDFRCKFPALEDVSEPSGASPWGLVGYLEELEYDDAFAEHPPEDMESMPTGVVTRFKMKRRLDESPVSQLHKLAEKAQNFAHRSMNHRYSSLAMTLVW